ncbi:helix-turn-helix domain-containing protein [Pontibacter roseus]|uniref:helix-turn-helix domain-containing protein n=1 Tax=Pontibacter roseus TaxID=336989 RepID=UPI00035E5997|nr:helix-turn-helix domain-containing protein [Pontibacter roseus]
MVIIQLDSEQLSALIQRAVLKAIGKTASNLTPATDELLSVQQAAQFLSLSPTTIYAMVQRRELPVSKRGGRLYFSKTELIDYVKAGRKKTAAEIAEQAAAYVGAKRKRG